MRGILNAGHGRDVPVFRTVGESFEVRAFRVSGPVALAGIGRIPATIEDRSITVSLRRRTSEEKIGRLRNGRFDHLRDLGRRAARWFSDNKLSLMNADPPLPDELGDRAQDNWRPLIAIADTISLAYGIRARQAALVISKEAESDDDGAAIMALGDVASIFKAKGVSRLSSVAIVAALVAVEERPWSEWRRGQPLTPNSLARLLRPFEIRPKQIRFAPKPAGAIKGYEAAPIFAAAARYVDRETPLEEEDLTEAM